VLSWESFAVRLALKLAGVFFRKMKFERRQIRAEEKSASEEVGFNQLLEIALFKNRDELESSDDVQDA
jgi:hypothetical protein